MAILILGFAFVGIAGVSLWDAVRITSRLRVPGAFDLIGPDRYLMGVAIMMGVLGIALVIQSMVSLRKPRKPVTGAGESSARDVPLVAGLLAYAVALPVVGYVISTIVFAAATFRIMGVRNWRWCVVGAIVLTACFYVAFVHLANMPLPAGFLKPR